MGTASLYEHYEQYVREYRSVLHLIDQILALRSEDRVCDAQARQRLLGEDAVTVFVQITERMQAQVSQGRMEVDVVLAALLYECCDKLALLDEGSEACEPEGERDMRQWMTLPARRLFQGACQRLLKGGSSTGAG